MREILFRGKRIDNGEWVVGIPWIFAPPVNKAVIVYAMGLVGEDDDTSRYCECHEVDPSTIGQYTGLTDKNGKRIFEGDIVNAYNEISGCIKFGEYKSPYEAGIHLGLYVEWENKYGYSSMRKDLGYWKDKIEVIGNATDNPELLEVRK